MILISRFQNKSYVIHLQEYDTSQVNILLLCNSPELGKPRNKYDTKLGKFDSSMPHLNLLKFYIICNVIKINLVPFICNLTLLSY